MYSVCLHSTNWNNDISAPILGYPNMESGISILDTDASNFVKLIITSGFTPIYTFT